MSHLFETERLLLRELTPDDAAFAFGLNFNPDVVRYTGDGPFESLAAARTFLENYSDYERNGFGRWGMQLKTTGKLIGWCGLKRDRETQEVDLGYRLFQRYWNNCYASEAAIACLQAGFGRFGIDRIVGRAAAANIYSWRILEKVGMTFVEEYTENNEPWKLYEQVATDFAALNFVSPGPH